MSVIKICGNHGLFQHATVNKPQGLVPKDNLYLSSLRRVYKHLNQVPIEHHLIIIPNKVKIRHLFRVNELRRKLAMLTCYIFKNNFGLFCMWSMPIYHIPQSQMVTCLSDNIFQYLGCTRNRK